PIVRLRALILLALLAATLLAPNYLGAGRPYLPDKVVLFALPRAATLIYAWRALDRTSSKEWLRESLWFARMIFPLLLAGVFVVGVVGSLLPEEWVRAWLGGSSLQSAFLATLIGAVSYFATLTEAPFVHTLMSLGMGKGPALGLLLAGPGLSMPSMIAIARIFGSRKALTYVLTSVALATAIAYLAGNLLWST
ncbi:MAG: permease, partial [Desulfurococcaceae archaeon]